MIDIHTHILPGVDDGSQNTQESLEMLKIQLNQGINRVVLTPHVYSVAQKVSSKSFPSLFENFQKVVKDKFPEISLYLGAELKYNPHRNMDFESLAFKGFNHKYILIEFSMRVKEPIVEVLYNLTRSGYTPILAHGERYLYLNLDDYKQIKKDGTLIQINSGAVLNLDGHKLKRRANLLLKNNLVDLIASDAHNTDTRSPNLKEALDKVSKTFIQKELT